MTPMTPMTQKILGKSVKSWGFNATYGRYFFVLGGNFHSSSVSLIPSIRHGTCILGNDYIRLPFVQEQSV